MTTKLTLLDNISILLPYNKDKLYVMCKTNDCDVYYPCKRITDNEEVQNEYMMEIKDLYQTTIDEVQSN